MWGCIRQEKHEGHELKEWDLLPHFMNLMSLLSKIDFLRVSHTLIIKDLWLLLMKAALGRR